MRSLGSALRASIQTCCCTAISDCLLISYLIYTRTATEFVYSQAQSFSNLLFLTYVHTPYLIHSPLLRATCLSILRRPTQMPRSAATAMLKVFVLLLVSTLGLAARQSKPATHVEVVSHDTASNTSFVAPYYRNVTIEEAWVLPRSNTLRQEMCDCPGTTSKNTSKPYSYLCLLISNH